MTNKLAYADDNMHSYVANVIQIEEMNYVNIGQGYCEIVETYLSTGKQLKQSLKQKNKELKGLDLLKTNFDYGIASMKDNEVQFYTSLFKMLNQYKVDNLLFMISKMSIITSSRLTNFFYFLDEETEFSPFIVKYVLTKYAEIEASKKVIEALLDKELPIRPLLKLIKEDITRIIHKNQCNMRMSRQLNIYEELINSMDRVIKNHKIKLPEPDIDLSFDWDKVKWAFDLWITERLYPKGNTQGMLFLDEGIPSEIFTDLELDRVEEGCNSKDYIGLQITDMIVVLIGKLVSQMTANTRYDFNKPDQRVLLDEKYFDLNERQYNLILEMNRFLIDRESNYHLINDSYFDESLSFQTYISYIASFDNFEEYTKRSSREHRELHFQDLIKFANMKYSDGAKSIIQAHRLYESLRNAVTIGQFRPL